MADDSVLAPIAAEPALPLFSVTKSGKAAIAVSDVEIARAQARSENGIPLMCLRFSSDRLSPPERFEAIRTAFGPGFGGIVITSRVAEHQISTRAHSVLTKDFVDEPGNPTRLAREQVVDFLKAQLIK